MKQILIKFWRFLNLPSSLQLFLMRLLNDQFLVGLTAIIFNEKNEVLLVRHTYRAIEWSLPGGYLMAKEHPVEGLEREIEEETGFIVTIDFPLKIRTDRKTGRLDMSYIGFFCGGNFKKSDEVYDYGFFSIDKLPMLIKSQVVMIKEAKDRKKNFLQRQAALPAKQNLFIHVKKKQFIHAFSKMKASHL